MKAVEFIAKFGWELALRAVKSAPKLEGMKLILNHHGDYFVYATKDLLQIYCASTNSWRDALFSVRNGYREMIEVGDLKSRIDAWELINKLGGIQAAKDAAYQNTMNVDGFDPSKIETAIALVEEVEKFKGVA